MNKNILIIDDDKEIVELLVFICEMKAITFIKHMMVMKHYK